MKKEKIPNRSLNPDSAAETFLLNQFYDRYIFQENFFGYQLDSWKKQLNYGLVNKDGDAIFPKTLSLASYTNNNNSLQENLFFVVDAFKDLKNYHEKFLTINKFDKNNSIYVSLNPVASNIDLNEEYIKFINNLYNVFFGVYLDNQLISKINSLNSFMDVLIEFLKRIVSVSPFNRSSFITFRKCPSEINALTISFSNDKAFSDPQKKAETYINDNNFYAFADHCKRFGFFINRNIPWKIVCDLESPITIDYYKKYGFNNSKEILDNLYHVAYYSDIESLTNVLISFWNLFVQQNPIKKDFQQIVGCDSVNVSSAQNSKITRENFDRIFNINWKLRFYIMMKIYENGLNITQNKFESIFNEAVKLNNYYNTDLALQKINNDIKDLKNKTNLQLTQVESSDRLMQILTTKSYQNLIF